MGKYVKLCKSIADSRYIVVMLREYLQDSNKDCQFLIMRHDIDQSCKYALDVASVEHKYGIKATYYFRAQRRTYIPDVIDRIASLGHEIGYHYETLDKCKGSIESAKALFLKELADFRKKYDIKTVCAHGNPLTKYDNKDIWNSLRLSDLGLLGEAFLTLDYNKFAYFSDSGRTWQNNKAQKMPGKDSVQTAFNNIQAKSTDDIIRIVKEGTLPNICILTHPERWSKDMISFAGRYALDMAFSWGKAAISLYREAGKLVK